MKKAVKKKKSSKVPAPDKLRKMISEDVNRYLTTLGMKHYQAGIMYMHDDINTHEHCDGGKVAAAAEVDMRYLRVSIKIYPTMVRQWQNGFMDDEEIHDIIAHEIAHTATNHMYRLATSVYKDEGETKDAWESLTTIIGRLLNEVDRRRRGFITTDEHKKKRT